MKFDSLPEVTKWFESAVEGAVWRSIFGRVETAILWTNERDETGGLIVDLRPEALVETVGQSGYPLYRGHDPGMPIGRVLDAKHFVTPDGTEFVAGVLGFYDPSDVTPFTECGVGPLVEGKPAPRVPDMPPESHIAFAFDPREVSEEWLDSVLTDAPPSVRKHRLSHNAADSLTELVRVGLPYVALVWNPFVTAVASEAGKAAYAALHSWLGSLWSSTPKCKDPIISVDSSQSGCHVSFLFRGNNVAYLYAAHEALPSAATQAAKLIDALRANAMSVTTLVYEFSADATRWYPAHATLEDGRLIAEPGVLIAVESGEYSLSLGVDAQEGAAQQAHD